MGNKFGKWSLEHWVKSATLPDHVYFEPLMGCCQIKPPGNKDIEPYRRLIASAPDLRELLIAALPALEHMSGHLISEIVIDRAKAALAFIDGVEPEKDDKL